MFSTVLAKAAICVVFAFMFLNVGYAQVKKQPGKKASSVGLKVVQIDLEGLKALIKPKGKPLLINFWATWCDPCRDEFPDLVKINAAYRGKIDFVTVSLDDLAEIRRDVPKFLKEVKSTMPAYLLKTTDDDVAISLISKDWKGNLPLTVLFDGSGTVAYEKNNKIRYETLVAEIEKVLASAEQKK